MEQVYQDAARILKAISDPKRLRIVDMLSCGELCACKILEAFHITQPTLSHDMRVLIQAGVVNDRRDGKNIFYSLNTTRLREFESILHTILSAKADCICHAQDCCE
ncbi:MAG: metalloregulator ArsR/SmtB family transcription factor [Clostridia bacterium]|nr:metalloregulator ArsR/SmtB family transcription factor [Clostridia bacterium]